MNNNINKTYKNLLKIINNQYKLSTNASENAAASAETKHKLKAPAAKLSQQTLNTLNSQIQKKERLTKEIEQLRLILRELN